MNCPDIEQILTKIHNCPDTLLSNDSPDIVLHELAHGWECTREQIHLGDFGLTATDLETNILKEALTLGLSSGMAECDDLTDIAPSTTKERTSDLLWSLLNEVWCVDHQGKYWEAFERGFAQGYAEGIGGCITS